MSEVLPAWRGATVVLVGGGPSLTQEDVQTVCASHARSESFCIAINASYLWTPWADVCYFADCKFWQWHTEGIVIPKLSLGAGQVKTAFAEFGGQKCSIKHSGAHIADDAVHLLENKSGTGNHGKGISLDPKAIVTGRHSGYQALNIAILAGANKILLLGYDGSESSDGKTHFHGGHPKRTPPNSYAFYRQAFATGATDIKNTGVRVVNCSPGSKISAFEFGDIENELRIESNEGDGV